MLHLPQGNLPLHERVAEALAGAVAEGTLRPGERLPPHRELAKRFGVAIGTITRAVDALSRRGIVRGEVGRGTFVQGPALAAPASAVIDLSVNAPPPLVPLETLHAAADLAVRRAAAMPNGGYVDVTGAPEQRAVLAGWLSRRPLDVAPDDLVLCVGAQQAISLAFADLRRLSATVATERATFSGAIAAAKAHGMTMLPVDHDAEGMIPDALDRVLREAGCRAVYATPVCQNPLGFETGAARRAEIVAVCRARGAMIVEDDIYGLYAAKTDATYRSLAPEITYYLTSLSKVLTPLVRVGMLVPPAARRPAVAERLRADLWGAPPLALAIGGALIEMGADGPALDLLRREAKARLDLAAGILGLRSLPMPEGAPHLWLPMPPLAAERFARRAGEQGVRLTPPDSVIVGGLVEGSPASGVRICLLATEGRAPLERALRILAGFASAGAEAIV